MWLLLLVKTVAVSAVRRFRREQRYSWSIAKLVNFQVFGLSLGLKKERERDTTMFWRITMKLTRMETQLMGKRKRENKRRAQHCTANHNKWLLALSGELF